MNLVNILLANWDILVFLIVLLVVLVYLWVRGGKSVVFKMLYAMVTEAEKEYGNGTGSLKLASVIEKIYLKLPAVVRLFVTANTLQRWVETVLEEAKKVWAQNKDIAIYISTPTASLENGKTTNDTEKLNE